MTRALTALYVCLRCLRGLTPQERGRDLCPDCLRSLTSSRNKKGAAAMTDRPDRPHFDCPCPQCRETGRAALHAWLLVPLAAVVVGWAWLRTAVRS